MANDFADGDLKSLAEMFIDSLKNVSSDLTPLEASNCSDDVLDIPDKYIIYPEEVYNKLIKINIHKSPGPDCIPNWLLRDFAVDLAEPLCSIFNNSIKEGIFPSKWKQANISLIPKVPKPALIESDFRPISLTPTVSKIFERLIGQHLLDNIGDWIDSKQYGAVKGRSTIHALIDICHHSNEALGKGHLVRNVFVDYKKAFDHISHPLVLSKLTNIGVDNVIIQLLHSFLFNRLQRVKLTSDIFSDFTTFNGGLPQGSWFGPVLFLVVINDLHTNVDVYKFIDDTTLMEVIPKDSTSVMQYACDELNEWNLDNDMNINVKKSCEMLMGGEEFKNSSNAIKILNTTLPRVTSYKLLGVYIQDNLKWNLHVNYVCSKVNRRLHFLGKLSRARIAKNDLVYFYCTTIRSVIEYGCQLWHSSISTELDNRVENLQKRALRIIYGYLPYDELLKLSNLQTLKERRELLCFKLFNDILLPTHCLNYLLPPRRTLTYNYRTVKSDFNLPTCRTERFINSFLLYCRANYNNN